VAIKRRKCRRENGIMKKRGAGGWRGIIGGGKASAAGVMWRMKTQYQQLWRRNLWRRKWRFGEKP